MTIQDVAKSLAENNKMFKSEKYDLFYRDFDNMVEVLGFVHDPNYDMQDFRGREMLFPKRWVTVGVLTPEEVYPKILEAGI